ncbi:hypothetical protein BD289DRAFT_34944 [Coniella lustricola]|uniref:Uncharacterized protein n=1 Tax=Coniella lustricola TaxID=2025994 RepID=A0A2T3A2D3_9PEZI|nr:hypothetical protein BD289DRAFT_34944 [Coniella lustricola]
MRVWLSNKEQTAIFRCSSSQTLLGFTSGTGYLNCRVICHEAAPAAKKRYLVSISEYGLCLPGSRSQTSLTHPKLILPTTLQAAEYFSSPASAPPHYPGSMSHAARHAKHETRGVVVIESALGVAACGICRATTLDLTQTRDDLTVPTTQGTR